ncbi:MAG: DUF3224 domain-containing protein [Aeromicrobium erythreum]
MSRSHHAAATFTVTSWDEKVVADLDGRSTEINGVTYPANGFSRADVTYAYRGDLEGTGTIAYLIAYRDGDTAPGFAFEHVVGSLGGHEGSFLLQHVGEHDGDGVRMRLSVVEGSGTGGLTGLSGEGEVVLAGHSEDGYPITLDYDV